MTPTQLSVTEEEYNKGSSARCWDCKTVNYFPVSLVDVSYQWNCAKCGVDNFHPCHQQALDKIYQLRDQLGRMTRELADLAIVVRDDKPKHNHQFTK